MILVAIAGDCAEPAAQHLVRFHWFHRASGTAEACQAEVQRYFARTLRIYTEEYAADRLDLRVDPLPLATGKAWGALVEHLLAVERPPLLRAFLAEWAAFRTTDNPDYWLRRLTDQLDHAHRYVMVVSSHSEMIWARGIGGWLVRAGASTIPSEAWDLALETWLGLEAKLDLWVRERLSMDSPQT